MFEDTLAKYNTSYQKKIIKKFADDIPRSTNTSETYRLHHTFMFILGAPEQFEVEDEMTEYLDKNPDCTVFDLFDYFDTLVPSGTLPPCASEWDDDEDGE